MTWTFHYPVELIQTCLMTNLSVANKTTFANTSHSSNLFWELGDPRNFGISCIWSFLGHKLKVTPVLNQQNHHAVSYGFLGFSKILLLGSFCSLAIFSRHCTKITIYSRVYKLFGQEWVGSTQNSSLHR